MCILNFVSHLDVNVSDSHLFDYDNIPSHATGLQIYMW